MATACLVIGIRAAISVAVAATGGGRQNFETGRISECREHPMWDLHQAASRALELHADASGLAALDAAGLVSRSPAGREVRYQVDAAPLEDLTRWAADTAVTWDTHLQRLRNSLE